MMYIYYQRTGHLLPSTTGQDTLVATGYSGFGEARNDPVSERRPGLGPIPRGAYLIGDESKDETHGPVAIHLLPLTGTETFGRSGFLVHGDSISAPGAASHGCIVVPRKVRESMADGGDRLLVVLSGNEVLAPATPSIT